MRRSKFALLPQLLCTIVALHALTACGSSGDGAGGAPESPILVESSVIGDNDNTYATGAIVRIDIKVPDTTVITNGTVRITSQSTGYDSGLQSVSFGSIFYLWDTASLPPAGDYVVNVQIENEEGQEFPVNALELALQAEPPIPTKLVSVTDLWSDAPGIAVAVVRSYLLDSDFNGPLGYGWTHSYRMRAIETNTNVFQAGVFVPVDGAVQLFDFDGTSAFFLPLGGGAYSSSAGDFRTLGKLPSGEYELSTKQGVKFIFTAIGELKEIVDRNGQKQVCSYTDSGSLEKVTDAAGGVTTFTYFGSGRIETIVDPSGKTVRYAYDSNGDLRSVTNSAGFVTTYTYDANHNLLTTTDPNGRTSVFEISSDDRLSAFSGPGGVNRVEFIAGVPSVNQFTIQDALGSTSVVTFDENGKIVKAINPDGKVTTMQYDDMLNLTQQVEPNGSVTSYTYDQNGNVLSVVDQLGRTTSFTYTSNFNEIKTITDPMSEVIAFGYDVKGNLLSITYPDGLKEEFSYDLVGNVISRTDRMGQSISFNYDQLSRLIKREYPDGTEDSFAYDAAGNITSGTDANGTIAFSHDGADRLTLVTYPDGKTVQYTYDDSGKQLSTIYPSSLKLAFAYDSAGRLSEISEDGRGMLAEYTYDSLSRVVRRDLGNGVFSTYTYDIANLLTELTCKKSTSEIIYNSTFVYDSLGNQLSKTTPNGTTSFQYDAMGQLNAMLTGSTSQLTFDLDPNGNRSLKDLDGAQTSIVSNQLNQYTSIGADTFTYDDNGNLESKTTAAGTSLYSYDFDGRLTSVITPTEAVDYGYDPFGRRTSKTSALGTINYVFDGLRVISESGPAPSMAAQYVYGLGLDEVIYMERAGQEFFYSRDELGSTILLTDATESVVEEYAYDAWGVPSTTSSVGNSYLFTGREYEPESELYYFRARFYDPSLGRFISPDPSGVSGGLNLYSYASNNSVNLVDPLGTKPKAPWWCQVFCGLVIDSAELLKGDISKAGEDYGPKLKQFKHEAGTILGPAAFGAVATLPANVAPGSPFTSAIPVLLPPILPDLPEKDDPAGDGGDSDGDGLPDDLDPDDDNDGLPDDTDPDPFDPSNPSCEDDPSICAGDPTFVQVRPESSELDYADQRALDAAPGLHAQIQIPAEGSLVRANIPFFGLAYGAGFQSYRLEYGEGLNPSSWLSIESSSQPQNSPLRLDEIDDSLGNTIYGNLGTWDTGLENYVYLPTHPAHHPVNLKGVYTIRLVVNGKNGTVSSDQVSVQVANVIPNALGGQVCSEDGKFTLTVPPHALMDSFRLMAVKAVEPEERTIGDRKLIGAIYEFREEQERFIQEAELRLAYASGALEGTSRERLGLMGWNSDRESWEVLNSFHSADGTSLYSKVVRTCSRYALVLTDTVAEQARRDPGERVSRGANLLSEGSVLIEQDFEYDLGSWQGRDGALGAEVVRHKRADDSFAAKVVNKFYGGTFGVTVSQSPIDTSRHSVIEFDYRIPPDVKVDFLARVDDHWYVIGFTDDPKQLDHQRVKFTQIGTIPSIIRDDEWHTATFDLGAMLATRTGNRVVEELVLADWDVPGFMKLKFGTNAAGATYYVDNFSIREPENGALADDVLVIDDFDSDTTLNGLGLPTSLFLGGGAELESNLCSESAHASGGSLQLSFEPHETEAFAGYITQMPDQCLYAYSVVSMLVKDLRDDGPQLLLGMRDRSGNEWKVPCSDYIVDSAKNGWSKIIVPLVAFRGVSVGTGLENLSLSIAGGLEESVTLLVDQIVLERTTKSYRIEDFERDQNLNLLGGSRQLNEYGYAVLAEDRMKSSDSKYLQISFGGNIGQAIDGAPGLSYASWTTELNGLQCSSSQELCFRIRGASGGELPNVYLGDSGHRWGVDIEKYNGVNRNWNEIRVPLRFFELNGVDLSHLTELSFAFEWAHMSGTIFIDDISIQPAGSSARK